MFCAYDMQLYDHLLPLKFAIHLLKSSTVLKQICINNSITLLILQKYTEKTNHPWIFGLPTVLLAMT